MTIEEFIKGCEHDGSYIPVNEVLRLMKEYAKHCCELQRQICADEADITEIWYEGNKDSIRNAPEPTM